MIAHGRGICSDYAWIGGLAFRFHLRDFRAGIECPEALEGGDYASYPDFGPVAAGMFTTAVQAAGKPWLSEDWEPMTEAERQPASEAEIEQVSLHERQTDGIRYLSGGIGAAEREWLDRHGVDYPLRLDFLQGERGRYVSRVALRVEDTRGRRVFVAESYGPTMLIDLPIGAHRAEASYREAQRRFAFDVKPDGRTELSVKSPD